MAKVPSLQEFSLVKQLHKDLDQKFCLTEMANELEINHSTLYGIIGRYYSEKYIKRITVESPNKLRTDTKFQLTQEGRKHIEERYNEGCFEHRKLQIAEDCFKYPEMQIAEV